MFTTLLIIFALGSLAGMAVIVLKKISALAELPPTSHSKESRFFWLKKILRNLPAAEIINYEVYLQKILSRARILTLRAEQKTGDWLEKLRQKSSQRMRERQNNYWQALKKARTKRK